jgi:hypothetical protein
MLILTQRFRITTDHESFCFFLPRAEADFRVCILDVSIVPHTVCTLYNEGPADRNRKV